MRGPWAPNGIPPGGHGSPRAAPGSSRGPVGPQAPLGPLGVPMGPQGPMGPLGPPWDPMGTPWEPTGPQDFWGLKKFSPWLPRYTNKLI